MSDFDDVKVDRRIADGIYTSTNSGSGPVAASRAVAVVGVHSSSKNFVE